jgi:hypothetical protein
MEVSKKNETSGKYEQVGSIAVYYPLLSELGFAVNPAKYVKQDDKGAEVEAKEEDAAAFPIYGDDKHQFAFDAVLAAVKAMARNRLVSGTATLKDGLTIPASIEELLESGGGNNGAALANMRAAINAFAAWIKTAGKTEAAVKLFSAGFSQPKVALFGWSETRLNKFEEAVGAFLATLTDEQAGTFSRHLIRVSECIAGAKELAATDE